MADMLTQDVIARLSRLNRRLPAALAAIGSPLSKSAPASPGSSLLAGKEVENASGRHWLVELPFGQVWSGGSAISQRKARDPSADNPLPGELATLVHHLPEAVMFLDLETCGFAGAAVFLVGLVHYDATQLVLSQLLARSYAEEKAILESLWQRTAGKEVLVSFNGKSFDWPAIEDRTILHRLPGKLPRPAVHCDLLHHARRRWKRQLPNCRLQTLEQQICGRHRAGDISGYEVPNAYHQFVRSGDPCEIRAILHHNALDLVTLVQLALILSDDPPR